jgi:coenzyme F420 hydrogenase subunit beta
MNPINVKYVTDNDLCNSCGFCEAVCPEQAVKMQFNKVKGFHEPVVTESICKECGKCLEVCQGYEVDYPKLNKFMEREIPQKHQIGNVKESMVLYSSDLEIRKRAASGGAITQLLSYLFDKGEICAAYVTKPSKKNAFEPEGFIAKNKSELVVSQMSIYNTVPYGKVVNEIKNLKGKIAVVTIPCQTHGLIKYLMMNPELKEKIFIIIGTFCGGYQTWFAHKYYFPEINVNFNEVQSIDYRYGEFPGQLRVGFKNGSSKEFKRRFQTANEKDKYNTAFNSNFYLPRCYVCADKGNIFADISAGDPWLPKFENEKLGKSLVVSRTELGNKIINEAVNAGYLIKETADFIDVNNVQKFEKERHGNQTGYKKIYKLFNKSYPKYKFLGENKIYSKAIYLRVIFDIFKISLQRKPGFWFLMKPLYVIDKHFRNIFILSNPYKYFKRKLKK